MKKEVYKEYKALTKYITGYYNFNVFQKIWFNVIAPIRFKKLKKEHKEEYALIEKAIKNKKEGKNNV